MRKIEDRLLFLKSLLTQPNVEQKIDHYHREILTAEAEELEISLKEIPIHSYQLQQEQECYG
jgi:hypothetical protein